MNFEWLKKHPYAAGAAILAGLVLIYMLSRRSGSGGGGLASLAAGQQQSQLALAQMNAQQSSQQQQLQAQLSAQEYQSQLAAQAQQDQLVGSVASSIIPAQLNAQLMAEQLGYQYKTQQSLLPLAMQISKNSVGRSATTENIAANELALLMGQGSISSLNSAYGSSAVASAQNNPMNTLLQGLFGTVSSVIP